MKNLFEGFIDYLRYIGDEIRNADKDRAGFDEGELLAVALPSNLKYPKGKTYAGRMGKKKS